MRNVFHAFKIAFSAMFTTIIWFLVVTLLFITALDIVSIVARSQTGIPPIDSGSGP